MSPRQGCGVGVEHRQFCILEGERIGACVRRSNDDRGETSASSAVNANLRLEDVVDSVRFLWRVLDDQTLVDQVEGHPVTPIGLGANMHVEIKVTPGYPVMIGGGVDSGEDELLGDTLPVLFRCRCIARPGRTDIDGWRTMRGSHDEGDPDRARLSFRVKRGRKGAGRCDDDALPRSLTLIVSQLLNRYIRISIRIILHTLLEFGCQDTHNVFVMRIKISRQTFKWTISWPQDIFDQSNNHVIAFSPEHPFQEHHVPAAYVMAEHGIDGNRSTFAPIIHLFARFS